jgi:hypothetical protein
MPEKRPERLKILKLLSSRGTEGKVTEVLSLRDSHSATLRTVPLPIASASPHTRAVDFEKLAHE